MPLLISYKPRSPLAAADQGRLARGLKGESRGLSDHAQRGFGGVFIADQNDEVGPLHEVVLQRGHPYHRRALRPCRRPSGAWKRLQGLTSIGGYVRRADLEGDSRDRDGPPLFDLVNGWECHPPAVHVGRVSHRPTP